MAFPQALLCRDGIGGRSYEALFVKLSFQSEQPCDFGVLPDKSQGLYPFITVEIFISIIDPP